MDSEEIQELVSKAYKDGMRCIIDRVSKFLDEYTISELMEEFEIEND